MNSRSLSEVASCPSGVGVLLKRREIMKGENESSLPLKYWLPSNA
jgi:hypothetical protein